MKKTYFFDMDGTLVVYEQHIFLCENKPWYTNIRGTNYFAKAKPYDNSLAFIKHLIANDEDVYLLTSLDITPKHMSDYEEHVTGKYNWTKQYLPELDASRLLICNPQIQGKFTKSIIAADILGRTLTKQDLLIDDYNPNLQDWLEAGGMPIKMINDVNSVRDDMTCLSIYNTIEENLKQLKR